MELKDNECKQDDLSNKTVLLNKNKCNFMAKTDKKKDFKKCVSKSKRGKPRYSNESLQKALEDIRLGIKSIRGACREYNIPRGTVQDRLHRRVADGPPRRGPMPVMGIEGENKICECVIRMSKIGFPITTSTLTNIVANLCKDMKQKTPFKDGIPGPTWVSSFLRRHPEISLSTPEAIDKDTALVTEDKIRRWFKNLREYLSENNALDILSNPDRILNGDESEFVLCPKTGKVLAPKGLRTISQVTVSEGEENVTVLLVFTASSKVCPPLVVFPYIRPPSIIPTQWVLRRSENGLMGGDIFYEYICNDFNKWLDTHKIKKPILLLLDGYKIHMTIPLSEFCEKNTIILYALPPRITNMLQPAEVSIFKTLEQIWQGNIRPYDFESRGFWNGTKAEFNFCPLFEEALNDLNISELIRNGFRKCGLFPLDKDAIDYTDITPSEIDTAIKVIKLSNLNTKLGIDMNLIIRELEAMKLETGRRKVNPKSKRKKPTPQSKTSQNYSFSSNSSSYVSLDDTTVIPFNVEDSILVMTKNISTDDPLALLSDVVHTDSQNVSTNYMGSYNLETSNNIKATGNMEELAQTYRSQEKCVKNPCNNIMIKQENFLISDVCSQEMEKEIGAVDDNVPIETFKIETDDSINIFEEPDYNMVRTNNAFEINNVNLFHSTFNDTSEELDTKKAIQSVICTAQVNEQVIATVSDNIKTETHFSKADIENHGIDCQANSEVVKVKTEPVT